MTRRDRSTSAVLIEERWIGGLLEKRWIVGDS